MVVEEQLMQEPESIWMMGTHWIELPPLALSSPGPENDLGPLIQRMGISDDVMDIDESIPMSSHGASRRNSVLWPSCPNSFPNGEWTNLLAGHIINLDHVLSRVYSINSDSCKQKWLGSLEVIVGGSNPLRTVCTHSNWVIAWDMFVQAALYVFPHQSNELTAYGKFIRQLFTSIPVKRHFRVIQFNRTASQ
ncbi:unnamed protein product [Cyclocybe aegerita]|uniref:Uncharacterized protein n=1 Tax=Cyclocybe aegerita TaxID=1973307 RepID=A0A8S0VSZ8_CYCAE|nr:unnamed protein product [Cyclocybe aegerita]